MDKKDIDSTKLSAVNAPNAKNDKKKRKKMRLNRKKIKYHNYTITLLDDMPFKFFPVVRLNLMRVFP